MLPRGTLPSSDARTVPSNESPPVDSEHVQAETSLRQARFWVGQNLPRERCGEKERRRKKKEKEILPSNVHSKTNQTTNKTKENQKGKRGKKKKERKKERKDKERNRRKKTRRKEEREEKSSCLEGVGAGRGRVGILDL